MRALGSADVPTLRYLLSLALRAEAEAARGAEGVPLGPVSFWSWFRAYVAWSLCRAEGRPALAEPDASTLALLDASALELCATACLAFVSIEDGAGGPRARAVADVFEELTAGLTSGVRASAQRGSATVH